ncbi:MAG TPA: hypothetical protein VN715_01300 [Roseiarcus sp.]|nr:hypothetical protein [Roseiarcus sp.]
MSIILTLLEMMACATAAGVSSYLILESREARHFSSAKAEELYTLIETFDQGLIGHFGQACSMIAEGCPYSPHGDANWTKLTGDSAKARMLVSFYFPSLWPQVKRADASVSAAVGALRGYQASRCDEETMIALEQSLVEMRDTMESLKHAVVMTHRDGARPATRARRPTAAQALRMAA